MKAVADDGYPAFYATNHVLTRHDLFSIASQQRLIDEIPWLEVAPITQRHKFATFTSSSPHFVLHSEPEEIQKLAGDGMVGQIRQSEERMLDEDNARTFRLLSAALGDADGAAVVREAYMSIEGLTDIDERLGSWRRFGVLRSAYYRFFGVYLFRYTPAAKGTRQLRW